MSIDVIVKWRRLTPADKSPLYIKTFDGLKSPYHPSVQYFKYGWNGWKYWMAETPFSTRSKPYWDRNECPSIHVSQDGVIWTEPEGLENPIIDLKKENIVELDYFSDPHLVYLQKKNRLELWFRLTECSGIKSNTNNVSLRKMSSPDGIHWGIDQIISKLKYNQNNKGLGKTVVSPAVLHDGTCYRIWYVDVECPNEVVQRGVSFSISYNGITWNDRKSIIFNKAINPWHIDVQCIDDRYYMLIYDLHDLTLWESVDGINFKYKCIVYKPTGRMGSCFRRLYRSCLVKDANGYKIYFSGWDMIDTHIGLLMGESLDNMEQVITNVFSFSDFLKHYMRYQLKRILFVFNNILRKFRS